jgi:hypothetical protein
MPLPPDLEKFSKSMGFDKAPPATATPVTPAATAEGSGGILSSISSGIEKAHDFVEDWDPLSQKHLGGEIARGEGKALGSLGLGAAKLAGHAFPSINKAIADSPSAQQLQQFVDQPPESAAETVGNVMTQGATMMAGPGWARAAGYIPKAYRYARAGVEGVEAAAKGALGGAVANPDDPKTGAMSGAAGSMLPGALGQGLRSAPVKFMGRWMLPETAWALLHGYTGVPFYSGLGPLVAWHTSPFGRALRNTGEKIVDQTGRLIGSRVTPKDWSRNMGAARTVAKKDWPGTRQVPAPGSFAGAGTPQMGGYATEKARQTVEDE